MRNPFRKQKNQTIAELESYYASQRGTKRTGVAWIMAIISLLITLIVIALLYFGIRLVYRTVTNDDTTVVSTTQNETDSASTTSGSTDSPEGEQGSGNDALTALLTDNDSDSETEGTVTDEAASTSREVAGDSNAASNATTPTTGGNELPNTGAGESLVILLASVVASGYLVARKRQLR